MCVCVFFPFILDIKFVGRTSRGHTGGRSHRISHPPSFCGACLNFSREKDSAIPFPRRPWSRILCTNDSTVLHPLGIFLFIFIFIFSEKNTVCRDRTHVPTCQRVTRYLWATGARKQKNVNLYIYISLRCDMTSWHDIMIRCNVVMQCHGVWQWPKTKKYSSVE